VAGLDIICVQRQPGRMDRLEPSDPPDYSPRLPEVTSTFPGLELPAGFFPSDHHYSSPWRTLLSDPSSFDDGLGAAIAGHKRLRPAQDESSSYHAATWPTTAAAEMPAITWPAPLGEIVMKATERSSPGAPGSSSSPSYTRSCSSDSGIVHSDFCCKPYVSPPRNQGNQPLHLLPKNFSLFTTPISIDRPVRFRFTIN
jgi:hypothetical protein